MSDDVTRDSAEDSIVTDELEVAEDQASRAGAPGDIEEDELDAAQDQASEARAPGDLEEEGLDPTEAKALDEADTTDMTAEGEVSDGRDEDVALEAELESLRDQHLRLAADFDNYRRRSESQMRKSWIRAQADLIRGFLDALDDLQRVTDVEPEATTAEAVIEGVDLVERKLFQAMAEAGAEMLNPVGEAFDPNTMEAVMRVPAEDDDEDDTVDQVFQKGYTFKGHLVRPARVSVKKHE